MGEAKRVRKSIQALMVEDAMDPVMHTLAAGGIYSGPAKKMLTRCGIWTVSLSRKQGRTRPRCIYCEQGARHPNAS